jgi:hypothetical protein
MSGVSTMIEFTPEAEARLDDYLRQVRAALAGAADVNPDEIEADIREHVENELRSAPVPVGLSRLEEVLARLGPPAAWGASDTPSFFRRARLVVRERLRLSERLRHAREALWRGPEDWRLAYLTFGAFAAGVLIFPLFPLFLVVAYVLGRSGIALAREKGVELGAARKWLLYPPVAIVSAVLLVAVLATPAALGAWAFNEVESAQRRVQTFDWPEPEPADLRDWRKVREWEHRKQWKESAAAQVEEDRKLLAMVPVRGEWAATAAGWFIGAGAVAVWWTVLGLAAVSYPRAVRAAFPPFCNRFERRHGFLLVLPALAVAVVWGVVAWEAAAAAGVI